MSLPRDEASTEGSDAGRASVYIPNRRSRLGSNPSRASRGPPWGAAHPARHPTARRFILEDWATPRRSRHLQTSEFECISQHVGKPCFNQEIQLLSND